MHFAGHRLLRHGGYAVAASIGGDDRQAISRRPRSRDASSSHYQRRVSAIAAAAAPISASPEGR